MATSSPWKDIDDKFCLCSICMEQLKEPKLLPCLHRYCKDCLNSIIMQGTYDVIKCPECREEFQIPTKGVDGFKTDFYSKSLVEYVQIKQSLKSDVIRECHGCSKRLRVAAYCFKCNDFLCKGCHNFHFTNKMMKDHQKHTLSLEDIETKNISIGKLASMRDAPRCHIHLEEISKLYCETCNNLPVCMACMLGEHKGHNLHEVKALAKLKKEELAKQLKGLEEIEKNKKPMTPAQAKEKLISNVHTQKEKVIKMHDKKDHRIMTEIQNIEKKRQHVKQEKKKKEKKLYESVGREKEKEIEGVKKKYDEILKVKKIEINNSYKARESSLEKELVKLREKRERLDQDKNELLKSIEVQLNENVKIIEAMSEHFDNMKKRFETLNLVASSILSSDNDWSAVQCIPDMCTAATNLMKDLKRDFPELTTLIDVTVNYKQYFFSKTGITKISENFDRKITLNPPHQYVYGITSIGEGIIVMSGFTSDWSALFIIVIDMSGRMLKEKILNRGELGPVRCCILLSQNKVATACAENEIGLYDVRDGSYITKNISDVIKSWPKSRNIRSVATDLVNNHILVGGDNSRDVYVIDDQLNYLHTLRLPEMIKGQQQHIIVSDGHLYVFDYDSKKCYATSVDGSESKLVGELMKPVREDNDFGPISVCTDKDRLMYVLWKNFTRSPYQCYLVQYNHDGSQVLTTRKVDGDAQVVTVVETSQGDKLAVATYSTQTVYLYDLNTED